MEIASKRTGRNDVENKPARYAALGVSEYWRFDETGDFHGTKLAGNRLVEGQYEPIAIEEIGDRRPGSLRAGALQSLHSTAPNGRIGQIQKGTENEQRNTGNSPQQKEDH